MNPERLAADSENDAVIVRSAARDERQPAPVR
jgi:hypothetical protein